MVEDDHDVNGFKLTFYKAQGWLQKIISVFVGDFVHVDISMLCNQTSCDLYAYTAFEGDTFKACVKPSASVPVRHTLFFETTFDVAESLERKCEVLMQREIPYNYSDSHYVMPFTDKYVHNELLIDTTADAATELFCSQAIILILRETLPSEHPLITVGLHLPLVFTI
jgi:hypothetical protein